MSDSQPDMSGCGRSASLPLDITTARRGSHLRRHPTAGEDPPLPTCTISGPLDIYDMRGLWTRLYRGVLGHSPFPCRLRDDAATQTHPCAFRRATRLGATAARNSSAPGCL